MGEHTQVTYSLPTDALNAAALALKAGRADALAEIHHLAAPTVAISIHVAARMERSVTLDRDDIEQEVWIALASLARRWQPTGGSFAGYLVTSLPWEMHRVVRRHSPSLRSSRITVTTMSDEQLSPRLNRQYGTDGRDWVDQLAVAEVLESLDPISRRIVVLHALCGYSLKKVAQTLGVAVSTVQRRYGRARAHLLGAAGIQTLTA